MDTQADARMGGNALLPNMVLALPWIPQSQQTMLYMSGSRARLCCIRAPSTLEWKSSCKVFQVRCCCRVRELASRGAMAYLKGIGFWGTGKGYDYTDEGWDARWPKECEDLKSSAAGITREGFALKALYSKYIPQRLHCTAEALLLLHFQALR